MGDDEYDMIESPTKSTLVICFGSMKRIPLVPALKSGFTQIQILKNREDYYERIHTIGKKGFMFCAGEIQHTASGLVHP